MKMVNMRLPETVLYREMLLSPTTTTFSEYGTHSPDLPNNQLLRDEAYFYNNIAIQTVLLFYTSVLN